MKFEEDYFEDYWRARLYKHPEEDKRKLKVFARKLHKAGWEHCHFEIEVKRRS